MAQGNAHVKIRKFVEKRKRGFSFLLINKNPTILSIEIPGLQVHAGRREVDGLHTRVVRGVGDFVDRLSLKVLLCPMDRFYGIAETNRDKISFSGCNSVL